MKSSVTDIFLSPTVSFRVFSKQVCFGGSMASSTSLWLAPVLRHIRKISDKRHCRRKICLIKYIIVALRSDNSKLKVLPGK